MAASLVYGRSRGLSLKIKRAELVNNSFDPGVRALALAGINLTTTNRVTLSTNTVPATGLWSVIDPQATNPSRFYRVAY